MPLLALDDLLVGCESEGFLLELVLEGVEGLSAAELLFDAVFELASFGLDVAVDLGFYEFVQAELVGVLGLAGVELFGEEGLMLQGGGCMFIVGGCDAAALQFILQ
jgi:hypothetical protein